MQNGAIHPESRALLGSWQALNGLAGEGAASEAMSRDATSMVDRLFLAQRQGDGIHTFKTVGAELREWTGRDLRDHDVASLFQGPDRQLIRALLDSAAAAPGPAVARVAAFGLRPGQRSDVELVFLPLLEPAGPGRMLGLFQPLSRRETVARPVLRFAVTALLPPDPSPPARPPLRLVHP